MDTPLDITNNLTQTIKSIGTNGEENIIYVKDTNNNIYESYDRGLEVEFVWKKLGSENDVSYDISIVLYKKRIKVKGILFCIINNRVYRVSLLKNSTNAKIIHDLIFDLSEDKRLHNAKNVVKHIDFVYDEFPSLRNQANEIAQKFRKYNHIITKGNYLSIPEKDRNEAIKLIEKLLPIFTKF
jgi:hypothetical protein